VETDIRSKPLKDVPVNQAKVQTQPPEVHVNDRILLRDRPWKVLEVTKGEGGLQLLRLEALDGDEPASLEVAVPPEEPQNLEPEELAFKPDQLDSLGAWANTHRILAALLVRNTGLVSGARLGRVALEPYQLVPAIRLLAKPRPSLLIADDVGLGKTVEAGLAMLELMARGRVRRVLVVVPPGLLEQWQQELYDKFGLEFQILGNASDFATAQESLPAGVSPWDALPRVITSIDYLKKDTVRCRALRSRWDLIIVDEAHALAESGTPQNPYQTQRTRLGLALRDATRSLLLLTATPHNGYAHAFRSLLELVEPTLATFKGSVEDLRRRVGTAMVRRMKSQIRRWVDGREEPVFCQRRVEGIPVQLEEPERTLLGEVSAYCSKTVKQAKDTEEGELVGFAMQIIKKRALSSWPALTNTLQHRLEALQNQEVRQEPPPPNELRDYQAGLPLTDSQNERTARRILQSAIPKEAHRLRAEVQALKRICALLKRLPGGGPKIEALLRQLKAVFAENPNEKVIVFTEYRDTLDAICARLEQESDLRDRYVVLHGGLTRRQRLSRQDQFARPQTRLLLATDAASEGLNLQHHCRRIIHLELPWNPNRLEQRNGRVDRYGQTRPPIIHYLYYPDSPEDDVLSTLVQKIERMTQDYVSTPDILGVLQGTEAIPQGLTALDATARNLQELKTKLLQLFDDRTSEFVKEVKPLLLIQWQDGLDTHQLVRSFDASTPLVSDDQELEDAVLAMLEPGSVKPVNGLEGVYRIQVPWAYRGEGVRDLYEAATFRRSVAARFPPDEVEFITPLHPLVRAMAAEARRRLLQVYPSARGLPPRRLAARTVPPEEPTSMVVTWLGQITGDAGLLEEHLIPIRVNLEGQVIGNPEENRRWLIPEPVGEVPKEILEALFRNRFEELLKRARREAVEWLCRRAEELRAAREQQAQTLRNDLERDVNARKLEIREEVYQARKLIDPKDQLILPAIEGHQPNEFLPRLEALASYYHQRLEEIKAFESIHDPPPPRPLGALFLVSEGVAS